jgi:hypothetical protein
MDNIRNNMLGNPCPNCGTILHSGEFHMCPIKSDDDVMIELLREILSEIQKIQRDIEVIKDK